jgi:hypothetical protein
LCDGDDIDDGDSFGAEEAVGDSLALAGAVADVGRVVAFRL